MLGILIYGGFYQEDPPGEEKATYDKNPEAEDSGDDCLSRKD